MLDSNGYIYLRNEERALSEMLMPDIWVKGQRNESFCVADDILRMSIKMAICQVRGKGSKWTLHSPLCRNRPRAGL